jgi:ribonuclease HII
MINCHKYSGTGVVIENLSTFPYRTASENIFVWKPGRVKYFFKKGIVEAGCDEAGRGCLAGPVFAAAVILPPKFRHPLINDSKQLTEEERDKLRPIIEKKALAWAVAMVDHSEIDRINILQASFKAMHLAIDQLDVKPELLLIDGNRFSPYLGIVHQCIVQGDATYASIAAASILAKTHRDEYMTQLHDQFPHYNWRQNKGYGTSFHRRQMSVHGFSPYHRLTFKVDLSVFEEEEEQVDLLND